MNQEILILLDRISTQLEIHTKMLREVCDRLDVLVYHATGNKPDPPPFT